MKPLQVYVDDTDLARLDAWARERGWTKSRAVRAAIRALTRRAGDDPLLAASGVLEGLPSDVSERFDRYLQEALDGTQARSPSPKRRSRSSTRVRR
jgi:hypothetical protein